MVKQAIPTLVVWILVVLALDLPTEVAAPGVVFAFALGWWEEKKRLGAPPAEVEHDGDGDELFERDPVFYA